MEISVIPTRGKLIVKASPDNEVSKGGIILSTSNINTFSEGIVVSMGKPQVNMHGIEIPSDVKEGDTVLFRKGTGTDITIDGGKYLLFTEMEIYAVKK
jgi:chaperonin GroES